MIRKSLVATIIFCAVLLLAMFSTESLNAQQDHTADKQWAKEQILQFKKRRESINLTKITNQFSYDKTMAALDHAYKINPEDTEILLLKGMLGSIFPSDKTAEKAIAWLNLYIGANPTAHKGYVYRGKAYHRLHKYELAISEFNKALEIHDEAIVHYMLAISYLAKGDFNNALIELYPLKAAPLTINDQYGIKWGCDDMNVQDAIGDAYYAQKKYSQAIESYLHGLDVSCWKAYTYDLYVKIALASLNVGRFADAESYFGLWIEGAPNYWSILLGRAIARYHLKDYHGAIADAKASRDAMPKIAKSYYILGLSYHSLGEYQQAKKHLKRSIELTIHDKHVQHFDPIYDMSKHDIEIARKILNDVAHPAPLPPSP